MLKIKLEIEITHLATKTRLFNEMIVLFILLFIIADVWFVCCYCLLCFWYYYPTLYIIITIAIVVYQS